MKKADIDIDVADFQTVYSLFDCVRARLVNSKHGAITHPCGVYFNPVPKDIENDCSYYDYSTMSDAGFFKIDFLNVSIYNSVKNEAHLKELLEMEPDWNLLFNKSISSELFQLNKNMPLLYKHKPKSVIELAALISVIRPAKRHLIDMDMQTILNEVWKPSDNADDFIFKKAHAVSYAMVIVLQLNLLSSTLK